MGTNGFAAQFPSIFVLVLLLPVLHKQLVPVRCEDISDGLEYLIIPAAGRSVSLGSLYDHHLQTFSTVNILKGRAPPEILTTIDRPHTRTKYSLTNTLAQRADLLQIDAELTLGLKSNTVQGGASGSFLRDTLTKTNSARGTLKFTSNTKQQVLEIFFEETKKHISTNILNKKLASHVVIGIDYGSNLYITFTDNNEENKEQHEISGKLELALGSAAKNLSANISGSFNSTNNDLKILQQFDLSLQGELNLKDSYPTDLTKLIDLIVEFPSLVKSANGGLGAQQTFYLLPIETLRRWMDEKAVAPPLFNCHAKNTRNLLYRGRKGRADDDDGMGLKADHVKAALLNHELADRIETKLDDIASEIDRYREYTLLYHPTMLTDLRYGLALFRHVLNKELGEIMERDRNCSDPKTVSQWKQALSRGNEYFRKVLAKTESEFRALQRKLRLISAVKNVGGVWLSKDEIYSARILDEMANLDSCKYTGVCVMRFYSYYDSAGATTLLNNAMGALKENSLLPIVIDCDYVEDEDFLQPCAANFGYSCKSVAYFGDEHRYNNLSSLGAMDPLRPKENCPDL